MLSLIAWIYGKVVAGRNYLYDRGVLEIFDLGAHTISIGNITTGGTGKTPLVCHVAKMLARRGETVCILTRGYKRKNEKLRILVSDGERILADPFTAGDEPYELALKLQGKAVVIADADRVSSGEWAKRRFGVTVFILDDGFQHRRVRRDVDIVCVDSTAPAGDPQAGSLRTGKLLPAGRLREPAAALRRANAVVLTRADQSRNIIALRSEISEQGCAAEVFEASAKIVNLDEFNKFRVFAFCGLGNPHTFYGQLRMAGVEVAGTMTFDDHHWYQDRDGKNIVSAAKAAGADVLVTSRKDAVKLAGVDLALPVHVAEIEMQMDEAECFAGLL